jgi:hypothetical protein
MFLLYLIVSMFNAELSSSRKEWGHGRAPELSATLLSDTNALGGTCGN